MEGEYPLDPEHKVTFGTLNPETGELENVRLLKQSDILKCHFSILIPDHYREEGSCKCDDAEHRRMMIAEWEYTEEDFNDIPLRMEEP
jgi:hypothetical protein